VSNDVARASTTAAVYAALLTPQGKFLHDMFILARDDSFLIDCEAERADDLLRRLAGYKLRAKVTCDDLRGTMSVWAAWDSPMPDGNFYVDPRLPAMGQRAFAPSGQLSGLETADFPAYDAHRLALGVADGSHDMKTGDATLAEGNFDLLNGIDWKKGCYVGQELTARMHYRGLAKKRLFPVRVEGAMPPPESALWLDGMEKGEMRSARGLAGLAVLNIDAARQSVEENRPFVWENSQIFPFWPDWMPQKG
ncbi:MAG: folate-binding protein YgfZ, partial [Alphaproteobacteria bacterium]|nr:folate-binding protein YgfZ [Alphaproteobacteria bacterium]